LCGPGSGREDDQTTSLVVSDNDAMGGRDMVWAIYNATVQSDQNV